MISTFYTVWCWPHVAVGFVDTRASFGEWVGRASDWTGRRRSSPVVEKNCFHETIVILFLDI